MEVFSRLEERAYGQKRLRTQARERVTMAVRCRKGLDSERGKELALQEEEPLFHKTPGKEIMLVCGKHRKWRVSSFGIFNFWDNW